MSTFKRQTVSEFIRESKPDWKPVKKIDSRASTRPFSGALTVHVPGRYSWSVMGKSALPPSFVEQIEFQMRQMLGEEDLLTLFDEEVLHVDDSEVIVPGSKLPGT